MYEIVYHKPATLAEALTVYQASDDPSYLSGGHTLIPTLKNRLAAPQHLIDVRGIPELHGIEVTPNKLVIGAATTHASVAASSIVKATIPALAGLAGSIGDVQVRHMGTIGGSTANNDPAADYPSAVLSLRALVHTDRRTIEAEDFFQGLYTTALEDGEIVLRIEFTIPETAGYAKFRNPASRYALAGAFVSKHHDGTIRVAITGAGNGGVFRWQEAEERLEVGLRVDALEGLTLSPSDMMGDMHAPADYRAHLVSIVTKRAVTSIGAVDIT